MCIFAYTTYKFQKQAHKYIGANKMHPKIGENFCIIRMSDITYLDSASLSFHRIFIIQLFFTLGLNFLIKNYYKKHFSKIHN